jgi:hypothetical protein
MPSNRDGMVTSCGPGTDYSLSVVTCGIFGASDGDLILGCQINALTEPERAFADTGHPWEDEAYMMRRAGKNRMADRYEDQLRFYGPKEHN